MKVLDEYILGDVKAEERTNRLVELLEIFQQDTTSKEGTANAVAILSRLLRDKKVLYWLFPVVTYSRIMQTFQVEFNKYLAVHNDDDDDGLQRQAAILANKLSNPNAEQKVLSKIFSSCT